MQPIFIKEFLPKEILTVVHNYCLLKYQNPEYLNNDSQTQSFVGEHGDYLMEALMDLSTPVIEQNVGKKLWPTYTYFRIYDKGSDLKTHTDRSSCEFTVALCLASDPVDQPYEIFIGERDETSDYKYYNQESKKYERLKIDHKFPMIRNNAVIFKGMEKLHWREYCDLDHYMTVFLHYVDQEGPYKEHKYDGRHQLGTRNRK
mgnify:CR=1 FL=1|tara:strand:+ start:2088 stop:2693 length:606 start_codon:yes stop_codon:yes gene_type:complete